MNIQIVDRNKKSEKKFGASFELGKGNFDAYC